MFDYLEIRDVHLEISSLCNAACPLCPRNFRGYPYNDGYPETNFTLSNAHVIFKPEFLKQLTRIWINGNYGDIVMNPEAIDIIKYFREHNKDFKIEVSTNGSARNKNFWVSLAELNVEVSFCLDGLEDTHHLYRQNTSWKTIIKNAKTFIAAGGKARWKFVKFDHNIHQIDSCRKLANDLGFLRFETVDHGRNLGPVFNKHGKHTHNIGNYSGTTEFNVLFLKKTTDEVLLEDIVDCRTPKKNISCFSKNKRSIYIAANGDVSPCCWTGFFPKTYGRGEYHQAINSQISPLIAKHNALEYPLDECIKWFLSVEQKWDIDSYKSGRLVVCDDYCGKT